MAEYNTATLWQQPTKLILFDRPSSDIFCMCLVHFCFIFTFSRFPNCEYHLNTVIPLLIQHNITQENEDDTVYNIYNPCVLWSVWHRHDMLNLWSCLALRFNRNNLDVSKFLIAAILHNMYLSGFQFDLNYKLVYRPLGIMLSYLYDSLL